MGTRSLTFVYETDVSEKTNRKTHTAITNMYRQFDGYPSGHGLELAKFLSGITLVNGFGTGMKAGTHANGMGCLAAQIVSHFKNDIGGIYLYNTSVKSCWQDYVYNVYSDKVIVKDYSGKFFGPIMKILGPIFSIVGKLGGLIGPIMRLVGKFLGPAALVAGAAAAGYAVGHYIEEKFDLGNKIGGLLSGDQGNKVHAGDEGKQNFNKKLEGTGYTSLGAGKFQDASGNTVSRDQLPPDVAAKLPPIPQAGPAPQDKAAVAAPAAQSAAAEKIDSASTENSDMKSASAAPVINQSIDARKTTQVMGGSGDKGGFSVYVNSDPEFVAHGLAIMRRIEPDRPIIVMIEDIDAIISRYGEASLLALLDGELQIDNVVFIATTNYPEELDARFVNRPSRFDEIIYIGMPSAKAREVYLLNKNKRLAKNELELKKWVDATDGWSIAHMRELIVAVECLDNPFKETVDRLVRMNEIKPNSENGEGRKSVGFT